MFYILLSVAGESINAKALGEEELKELGVSFGGRMILRKLIIAVVFGVVIYIIIMYC